MEKSLLLLLAGYTLGTHIMFVMIFLIAYSWRKKSPTLSPNIIVINSPSFDKAGMELLLRLIVAILYYRALLEKSQHLPVSEDDNMIYLPEKIEEDPWP